MIPSLRIVPAGAAHLAADPAAPCTIWFAQERELLQVATSAVGLGIDLTGPQARVVAGRRDLEHLAGALADLGSGYTEGLRRFIQPVSNWQLRSRSVPLDGPVIMGILNLTSDSFSGDGVGTNIHSALKRAEELRDSGAVIIDVGAESARADRPVLEELQEAALVREAVAALTREGHLVSSDTYKPVVARAALDSGAELVNDISGLTLGMDAAVESARCNAGYVLNYSYSVPKRRPETPPEYSDVVTETVAWFEHRIAQLVAAGLGRERIAIDPGIAFGKSHDEDIQVLRRIGELTTFGQPVLLAHSRKNFIGSLSGQPPAERDLETHVISALAFTQGVRIFRVHDPAGARRALAMTTGVSFAVPGAFAPDASSWPWRAGATAAHMTSAIPDKPAPAGQRW